METLTIDLKKKKSFEIGQQGDHNALCIHFINMKNVGTNKKYIYYTIDGIENCVPLTNDRFIVGYPLTAHSGIASAQLISKLNDNSIIKLSNVFAMHIKESKGYKDSGEYPVDPNIQSSYDLLDDLIDQTQDLINNYNYATLMEKLTQASSEATISATTAKECADELKNSTDFINTLDEKVAAQDSKIEKIEASTSHITTKQNTKIAALKTRMSSFTSLKDGSTTGDAELIDARIGADGTKYASAGDAMRGQVEKLNDDLTQYIYKPTLEDNNKFPRAKDGNVEWVEQGMPTDEQTSNAINNWLNAHPEATTTVSDNSLTINKMVIGTLGYITPEMFGAYGNGEHDDTVAIQSALNKGGIVVLKGNYKVTSQNKLHVGLKDKDINYCLLIPSNTKVYIEGKIYVSGQTQCFISNESSNITISGGVFIWDELDRDSSYSRGCIAFNNCKNVIVDNVYSTNSVVTAFSCENITTSNCIYERINSMRVDSAFGYHATSHSIIEKCVVLGNTNDGDILCYGNCHDVKITNCYLKADHYTLKWDIGAQGICIDSGCYNCTVTNNYAEKYYAPIDIKTLASGIVVTSNQLKANVMGIRISEGEQGNINDTILVDGNIIDFAGGVRSFDLQGTDGLASYTIRQCGIFVSHAQALISNNVIYSTDTTDSIIGIYLFKNESSVDIVGNRLFNYCTSPEVYISSGLYIACNGGETKTSVANITANVLGTKAETFGAITPIKVINSDECKIVGNVIKGGTSPFEFNTVSRVIINSNEISGNPTTEHLMSAIDTSQFILCGNTIFLLGGQFRVINKANVTLSASKGNLVKSNGNNVYETGCEKHEDMIIKGDGTLVN